VNQEDYEETLMLLQMQTLRLMDHEASQAYSVQPNLR